MLMVSDSLGLLQTSYGKHEPFKAVKQSEDIGNEVGRLQYIWYLCALNALLGVVGREMLASMNEKKKRAFVKCLKNIKEDLDIPSGARCIVAAMDNDFRGLLKKTKHGYKNQNIIKKEPAFLNMLPEKKQKRERFQSSVSEWIDLSIKKISSYISELWKKKAPDVKVVKKRSTDDVLTKFKIKVMDKAPNLSENEDSYASISKHPLLVAAKAATNIYKSFNGKSEDNLTWKKTYAKLMEIQKMLDAYKKATKRHYRLINSIIDIPTEDTEEQADFQQFVNKDTPPILRELYSLLYKFGKHNGGQPDLQLLSPRLAPLLPDPDNTRRILSPNILPLYDEDPKKNNLTVPGLLRLGGVPEKEQNAIMDLIMHISGAQETLTNTLNRISSLSNSTEAQRIELTKHFKDLNESINESFSLKQKSDLQLKNYTFLSKDQLLKVFALQGSNSTPNFAFDLDEYDHWTPREKKKALFDAIRTMADSGKPQNGTRRYKRQILAPFIFIPTLFNLVVLSPVILSPNIFSPNIFAPLVLTPLILTPQLGDPRVFSPYVLSPLILSPQLMGPNVFSPYALSPNILSPVALSPIVFSPPVLSPNVFNPTLLSGPIFSPLLLSPSIKSKAFWGISLFSPSALS
uniref:BRO1 domain-containing protein n=1 Tax=Syphacia muris TaxID=451379 RepID=A0A0N5APY8_9BILA